jgi:hypothetical protein
MFSVLLTGDKLCFCFLSNQDVERWNAWRAFLPKEIDDTVKEYFKFFRIEYIIVDERISRYRGEYGHYFNNEKYQALYPVYGSTESLPKECLDKFDSYNTSNKVYNNGNIHIYKIF